MLRTYFTRIMASVYARFLFSIAAAALVGGIAGVATIYAETKSNLFVNGYGNVMEASTWGRKDGPTLIGQGQTYTSSTVHLVKVHSRIWHLQSSNKYVIQDQDPRQCNYCFLALTREIGSVVYDAYVSTQSHARAEWNTGNSYYTSYPDNSRSCYRY